MSHTSVLTSTRPWVVHKIRSATNLIWAITVWIALITCGVRIDNARAADTTGGSQQHDAIQEVVRVANKYIKSNACEPSFAESRVVATLVPYSGDVAAGRATAKFAVLWSGDIGCRNGSGTDTMNILYVEKLGTNPAHTVDADAVSGAASFERIVTTTPDTLTVDVYTWSEDDPRCCASKYERWTLRREVDTRPGMPKGLHRWVVVDSMPAEPVPLAPGEKKLPTAKLDY